MVKALLKLISDSLKYFDDNPNVSVREYLDSPTGETLIRKCLLMAMDAMKAYETSDIQQ